MYLWVIILYKMWNAQYDLNCYYPVDYADTNCSAQHTKELLCPAVGRDTLLSWRTSLLNTQSVPAMMMAADSSTFSSSAREMMRRVVSRGLRRNTVWSTGSTPSDCAGGPTKKSRILHEHTYKKKRFSRSELIWSGIRSEHFGSKNIIIAIHQRKKGSQDPETSPGDIAWRADANGLISYSCI